MARYVVMKPPSGLDDVRIVRDGFALFGFLFPPIWLLWHRLWLAALLASGLVLGLSVLGEATGLGISVSLLSLLVSLFVGLEGRAMVIAALGRRGWTEIAAFEADSLADAEIRYAFAIADVPTTPIDPQPVEARPVRSRPGSGPALGMLSYPGQD